MTSLPVALVLALLLQPPATPDPKPEGPKPVAPAQPPVPATAPPVAPANPPANAPGSPAATPPVSTPTVLVPRQPAAPAAAPVAPEVRIANWREDLKFLATELVARHPNAFFKCKREDFDAAVAALDKQVPELADDQVVVGLMKIAAMPGDFHTGIGVAAFRPPPHYFPFGFAFFSDGLIVGTARESQKDLIGCTVVKVGGTPVDEAMRRAGAVMGFENESTFKNQAPRLVATAEVARAVGLIPTLDTMTVVVRDSEGKERTAELTPMTPGEILAYPRLENSQLPLFRQMHGSANWYQMIPDTKALYFHYDRCMDDKNVKVVELTNDILKAIDANGVERVIVDVRANGGGNSGFLLAFIQGLKFRGMGSRPGSVIVLIGRGTFSSAQMNAAKLKSDVDAVLMGEPTGQKPNSYGEIKSFRLPHSQIEVHHSTKFFKTEEGDRPSMEPDVKVEQSSKDYFEGRDPLLEAALKYKPK